MCGLDGRGWFGDCDSVALLCFLSMSSIVYTNQNISVHRICSDSLRALAM